MTTVRVTTKKNGVVTVREMDIDALTPHHAATTEWPLFLRPVKLLARDGDKGLGDIIARTIGPIGGDKYKAWYLRTFGRPCGCEIRQEDLNARYPL